MKAVWPEIEDYPEHGQFVVDYITATAMGIEEAIAAVVKDCAEDEWYANPVKLREEAERLIVRAEEIEQAEWDALPREEQDYCLGLIYEDAK